jgi:flagellar protein FlaJ
MILKILIKIGSKTINLHRNIFYKDEYRNPDEKIENKTLDELIKQNNTNKNKPNFNKIIIVCIIILLMIITHNYKILVEISLILSFLTIYKKSIPKIKEDNKKKEIMKNYPYALRQMSTQLNAGIGLYDALKIIANSNYGALSDELNITINEIQYGNDYVKSFENLSQRTKLKSMEKLVNQIIRTLNNGGNLANTLKVLADENSYNMKIRYKEYSEKLNAVMLIYMFIAVLLPVIMFIMIIAATTVMGSIIRPELLLILYLIIFPLIIILMIIFIKKMEPSIS